MAWTATLTRVEMVGGVVYASIEYSDELVTWRDDSLQAIDPPGTWLEDQAAFRIAQLERASAFVAGKSTPSKIVPTLLVDDAGEAARAAYRDALSALERQVHLVELGVAPDSTLATLKVAVETAAAALAKP